MNFRLARLRGGEWIVGIASLALLVVLFAMPWFGLKGVFSPTAASLGERTTADGWNSLTILGPLALIVGLLGLGVWWLQATRSSPALPVCAAVTETLLSFVLCVGLIIRVLLDQPQVFVAGSAGVNTIEAKTGAYAGLGLAIAVLIGAYLSLREDGIHPADAPQRIETLRLTPRATPRPR